MTNKEAARTLLYGLSRETSKETYLDALCIAICALMREEEAGKGKHEAKINIPDEPPPWEEEGTG